MTLPYPEYDTAADAAWPELDQDEREQVQAVAAAPVGSRAKAAIALGGAYLVYRQFMKNRMARRLRNSDDMSPEELERAARLAYLDFVPVWSYMVVPAVFSSLLIGVEEAGQAIGSDLMRDMARNYSWNLGSYLNQKAITSAKRGYQAQVNRKIERKKAKDNVVKAFGTTLPGMRSLVGIWTEVEPESTAEHTLTSTKAARVRRVIFGDEKTRAKTIGEEETFSLTSIGKQAAWAHAQQQGLIPMNATRQWITAKDELVCEVCGPLHKQEMPIGEPFLINGKKIWAPSLHPNCRCEVKLKAHLGQEAVGHVSRMLTDTRQWTSADDSVDLQSVGKSDNDWETQPRAKTGRFGARPHTQTTTRDLLAEATVAQETDLQQAVNAAQTKDLQETKVAEEAPAPSLFDAVHQDDAKPLSLFDAVHQDTTPSLFTPNQSLFTPKGASLFTPSLFEQKQAASLYSATPPTSSLYERTGKSLYGRSRSLYTPPTGGSLFEEDEESYTASVPRNKVQQLYGLYSPKAGDQDHYKHEGDKRITTKKMRVTSDPLTAQLWVEEAQDKMVDAHYTKHTAPNKLHGYVPPDLRGRVTVPHLEDENMVYVLPTDGMKILLEQNRKRPRGATALHDSMLLRVYDVESATYTKTSGFMPASVEVPMEYLWQQLNMQRVVEDTNDIALVAFDEVPQMDGWADLRPTRGSYNTPSGHDGWVSDYYRVAGSGVRDLDVESDEYGEGFSVRVFDLEGIDQDHEARLSDDRLG